MSIRLSEYFSADIRLIKIWRLIWLSAAACGCKVTAQFFKVADNCDLTDSSAADQAA